MSEQTLRAIHERCKARHVHHTSNERFCRHDNRTWPCADYSDAVAALNLLDEAERETVPVDVECGDDGYTDRRLIPDPLPRVSSVPDEPHATKETT